MRLIENGGIIEVGIPKLYYKFKTKRGLLKHINKEVNLFLNTLEQIGEVDIFKTDFFALHNNTDINDFDYNCYNQCEKSKTHDVYRFFDFTCFGLSDKELKEDSYLLDLPYNLKFYHKTKYGRILISITFSSEGIYSKKKSKGGIMYRLMLAESEIFIKDEKGNDITFKSHKKANEERIYLQPDIEDRIVIEGEKNDS